MAAQIVHTDNRTSTYICGLGMEKMIPARNHGCRSGAGILQQEAPYEYYLGRNN